MRELLMVSHPRSGFGIYLPDEARDVLGGLNSRVSVTARELDNGTIEFLIIRNKDGNKYVRKNIGGTHSQRIFWRRESPIPSPVGYHFGDVRLGWEVYGEGIRFVFPRKSELKEPNTKTFGRKPKREPLLGFARKQG